MKKRTSCAVATVLLVLWGFASPAVIASDWWILYSTGARPQRELFLADSESTQDIAAQDAASAVKGARFLQLFEGSEQPEYLSYEFQAQCKARMYRLASVVAKHRDGSETKVPLAGHTAERWTQLGKRSNLRTEQHLKFVCEDARKRKRNTMLQVGQFDPDSLLVAIWGTVWQDGNRPPVQRKSRGDLNRARADKAADLLKVFGAE